jgi:hypothetical protein
MAPASDAKARRVVIQSSPVKGATSPFKAKQLGKLQGRLVKGDAACSAADVLVWVMSSCT